MPLTKMGKLMLRPTSVISELPVIVQKMVKRMTIRAKKFQIIQFVMSCISVYMVKFQQRLYIKATSLTYTNVLKKTKFGTSMVRISSQFPLFLGKMACVTTSATPSLGIIFRLMTFGDKPFMAKQALPFLRWFWSFFSTFPRTISSICVGCHMGKQHPTSITCSRYLWQMDTLWHKEVSCESAN